MNVTAVLAVVCTALAVFLIWPQVIRVYRLNSVEGLSTIGTLHGLAGCTLWTMYGITRGILPVFVSNVSIMMAVSMIGIAQVRHRVLEAAHLIGLLVAVVTIGAIALTVSTTLGGSLAIVVAVTSILPQVVRSARTGDQSAVSVPTYSLISLSAVLWSVYGAVLGDVLLIVPNLLFLPLAGFVAWRAWHSQNQPAILTASVSV